MNIAVFCSSSNRISSQYINVAKLFGQWVGKSGNALVYGGATGGLMDAVAIEAANFEAPICGVISESIVRMNKQSSIPTTLFSVSTLAERKLKIRQIADVFVVLPGGYGTLDEMFDVIASGVVGEHKKKLFIVNQNGFYDDLIRQVNLMRTEFFIPTDENYKPIICTDIYQCQQLISSIKN